MTAASRTELEVGISVVVPVYNSEGSVGPLCDRLAAVLPGLTQRFEVIFVEDGSRDASWERVSELAQRYAFVRAFRLMRNFGQHNALLCGVRQARFATTVTLDDDLQHPPEEIVQLLRGLSQGFDVVYGVPQEPAHALWRSLASRYTRSVLSRAMGIDVRQVNAFRAFRTDLRRAFADYHSPNLVLDVLLSWGTTRFEAITVRHEPRRVGRSNYNFARLFDQAMYLLTGFSTGPLRLASFVGFAFTIFGFVVLVYAVSRYLISGSVPGFTFLSSIIAIFSGAQLFSLGIIGEYMARIFHRSMERPTYVVGSEVSGAATPAAAPAPANLPDAAYGMPANVTAPAR